MNTKKSLAMVVVASLLALSLGDVAEGALLASSYGDWQGSDALPHGQWDYGRSNGPTFSDFTRATNYAHYNTWIGGDGYVWDFSAYPKIGQYSQSPATNVWAVRRWTSDYTGAITVLYETWRHHAGTVTSGIYKNGAVLWSQGNPTPANGSGTVTTTVAPGDTIDLGVNPHGTNWSDWTYFTGKIYSGTLTSDTYTWDNGAGTASWGAGNNWNPDASASDPGELDQVVFNNTSTAASALDQDRSIYALTYQQQTHSTDLQSHKLTMETRMDVVVDGVDGRDLVGNVTVQNGTLQLGQSPGNRAVALRVGVNLGRAGEPTATLNLTNATLDAYVNTALIGYNYGPGGAGLGNEAHGTVNLADTNATIVAQTMYVGGGGRATSGTVTVDGGAVQIGQSGNRTTLRIGYEHLYQYGSATGSFTALGGGETVTAYLDELHVGRNNQSNGGGVGTLDLRNAALTTLDVDGNVLIGNGSQQNSKGYVYLGPGWANITGDLIVGDTESGTDGLLELFGATVAVDGTLDINATGEVQTHVLGASAGIELSSSIDDFELMHIMFEAAPTGSGWYYGFKVAGNVQTYLENLNTAGDLTWATSGGAAGLDIDILYDVDTDATYVGTHVISESVIPEPATMCALGLAITALGGYVRKRRRA